VLLSVRHLRSRQDSFAPGVFGFVVAVLIGWEVSRAIWSRA
jgi:hypothetical protein